MRTTPPYLTRRDVARSVPCPVCGVQEGAWCRRNDGFFRKSCHAERHQVARNKITGRQTKDVRLNEAKAIKLVSCPVCGVDSGADCLDEHGNKRKRSHHERQKKMHRALKEFE